MHRLYAVLVSLVLVTLGCGESHLNESALRHDVNQPTNGDHGYKWQALTDSDMTNVVEPLYAALNGNIPQKLMRSDKPVVKRLQYWVDRLHNRLVSKFPEKMKDVVKPRVNVLITDSPNAFVMPVPVCYDVSVILDPNEQPSPLNMLGSVALSGDGSIGRPWSGNTCIKSTKGADFFEDYVADFNKLGLACKLTYKESDNAIVVGNKCPRPRAFAPVVAAAKLVMYPTAGMITIHSGLLPIMKETEVVSVIAHELGHYYKVHTDHPFASTYDYYYTLENENPNHKPKAEAGLARLGEAAKRSRLPNAVYRDVVGQSFRSELFIPAMLTGAIISSEQKCDEGDCNEACNVFYKFSQSDSFKSKIGKFPFQKLNATGVVAYKEFESKAKACFKGVKVSEDGVETGESITPEMISKALTYDKAVAPLFAGTTLQDTVDETFVEAESALKSNELKFTADLREATNKFVGQYTAEQEADELSVEWMVDIGLSPEAVVDSQLALGEFVDTIKKLRGVRAHPTALSVGECKALYKNDWRDSNGKYVIVPIGNYADPHHSTCFRVFNADREIDAHKFPRKATASMTGMPGGSWKTIQQAADLASTSGDGVSAPNAILSAAFEFDENGFNSNFRAPIESCVNHVSFD